MVSKWLERKIEDIIFGVLPIPYFDEEIVQVAEGFIGVELPGLPHIDLRKMSTGHKILLVIFGAIPVLDVEYLDLVGLDPFKADEASFHANDTELDPLYDRGSGQINNQGTARSRARGSSSSSTGGGSILKKLFLNKFTLTVIPLIIVLVVGVGIASGSGYTDLVANQAGFQVAGLNIPAIGDTIAQAGKTVECIGNVACVRQWQFNNTQRPGSEAVGQEYSLNIENFGVNDGFPLDVANRRSDDRVPVDFSVYNPRHGLKGITARNVAYRIRIYDNVGSIIRDPDCQTSWMPLGGEYTNDNFGENGTILPGGFATPLGTHGELELRECGLLQPALGLRRHVKLQVAYDYSSQSTLQVQAMSNENMRSLEERPSFKKSQTADTPVKTYVNVESPITYRINDNGGAESSVFGLKVGFETGQKDVNYRVDTAEFKLYDSSKTVDVDSGDIGSEVSGVSCKDLSMIGRSNQGIPEDANIPEGYRRIQNQDLNTNEDTSVYAFSGRMTDYLSDRQSGSWFESGSGPSPARCAMVLKDPRSISPTGETLTFRIDANYTVMLEEKVEGFKSINSRCENANYNCPMLVPASESSSDLISECESSIRVDANNGCDVRSADNWRFIERINKYDREIEEGETAYLWSRVKDEMPDTGIFNESVFRSENPSIGLKEENFVELMGGKTGALIAEGSESQGDVRYESIGTTFCQDNLEKAREMWVEEEGYEAAMYFNPETEECNGNEYNAESASECGQYEYYENDACHPIGSA